MAHNHFDHVSALILGDALLENDKLKSLDISFNRLGDLGIRNILYPLLIQGFCKIGTVDENHVVILDRKSIDKLSRSPDL